MKSDLHTVEAKAIDLMSLYGRRARKEVEEYLLEAARNHDLSMAHFWTAVGDAVDMRLTERRTA